VSDTTLSPPPNGLLLVTDKADPRLVEAADRTARAWQHPRQGELRLGSEEHRQATCAMFRDTFNPYKPSIIEWPKLSPEALARLTSLPIWDIAVQTEGKARLRMLSYARRHPDPEWQAAIEQNGWEEGRHKVVLSHLVTSYGIELEPEPEYIEPRDAEWAYMSTGFSECVDSFFAFGLFELAGRSGYFPPELVDTFEPVIQEEARHILLFANWLAWQRRNLPIHKRLWFELRVWAIWATIGWERLGLARGMGKGAKKDDVNFTVTGAGDMAAEEVTLAKMLEICLAENDRRFAGYDQRLLRPTTMPALARAALAVARVFRRR
jgi:hypothetical protein